MLEEDFKQVQSSKSVDPERFDDVIAKKWMSAQSKTESTQMFDCAWQTDSKKCKCMDRDLTVTTSASAMSDPLRYCTRSCASPMTSVDERRHAILSVQTIRNEGGSNIQEKFPPKNLLKEKIAVSSRESYLHQQQVQIASS